MRGITEHGGPPRRQVLLAEREAVGPEAVSTKRRRFRSVRGAKPFPNVFLRQLADPFFEIGITPRATAPRADHYERDEQRPQEETGTGVVDGQHRTRHAGAYATPDDRQVQLSWNLLWQDYSDGHRPVGDWIYM